MVHQGSPDWVSADDDKGLERTGSENMRKQHGPSLEIGSELIKGKICKDMTGVIA